MYLAALRRLADTCGYGDHLEEALRDQFVHWIHREATLRKLLAMEGLTLQAAFDTAYSMEVAEQHASELGVKSADHKPLGVDLSSACYRCGKTNHSPQACFYKQQKCRACGKLGHISRMCQSKGKGRPKPAERTDFVGNSEDPDEPSAENEDLPLLNIRTVRSQPSIMLPMTINGKRLPMELDTGASISLISEGVWTQTLGAPKLAPSQVRLTTYTGQGLKVLGELTVRAVYRDQEKQLPLVVVAGGGPALFGRNWLGQIQLDWTSIHKVSTPLDQLLKEYKEVFRLELGTLQGVQAKLVVKPDASPKFHKPRSVPYALKTAIEQDLEHLEQAEILTKVKFSDWAAPVVPVPKADGRIRICGDYKVTINPVLQVDQFPMPTPEDLFATVAGGKTFSKLDLSQAYQQVLLEPDSRRYITISTHKGLYQYNRLPFGVASAPAILVTGKSEEEHL